MKSRLWFVSLLGLIFVSCASSTPQSRIQKNPQVFAKLTNKQREAVEKGTIIRDMTRDAVLLAWGAPSNLAEGSSDGRATERWDYTGSYPIYTQRFNAFYSGRFGRGRCFPVGLGTEVDFIPYRSASVWFVNDRVKSWERVTQPDRSFGSSPFMPMGAMGPIGYW